MKQLMIILTLVLTIFVVQGPAQAQWTCITFDEIDPWNGDPPYLEDEYAHLGVRFVPQNDGVQDGAVYKPFGCLVGTNGEQFLGCDGVRSSMGYLAGIVIEFDENIQECIFDFTVGEGTTAPGPISWVTVDDGAINGLGSVAIPTPCTWQSIYSAPMSGPSFNALLIYLPYQEGESAFLAIDNLCFAPEGYDDPPLARFTASPTSGPAELTVEFTNNSIKASERLWDFGDGTTSTERNPTHTYTDVGVYAVTLTVTNEFGEDTSEKAITVYPTTMHVNNIVMFKKSSWWWLGGGIAVVQIVDKQGLPMPDLTVAGEWSGGVDYTVEFATNEEGWGISFSPWVQRWWEKDFTFCVTDVIAEAFTYAPEDNVESCLTTPES